MSPDPTVASDHAAEIVDLARDVAQRTLVPLVAEHEANERFPREVFRTLGQIGLLGMPYAEEEGGGGQTYETYLRALEEIATAWASVAVGISVHVLTCFPLSRYGTPTQRARWLPEMLSGDLLGAYCLSEADAGSDPAAMRATAVSEDGGWRISGSKAWVTHGGHADYYLVFARTSEDRGRGISCFLVPGDADGLTAQRPEAKMGLTGSATATVDLDGVWIEHDRLIGELGEGLPIALAALDSGRLGIATVATGVARAALDCAVTYARERQTFGRPIIEHQGLGFLLADMAAGVHTARVVTLDAARRRDRGHPFSVEASIAKLVATDTAMRVTTDAVQVLGGAGYTKDFPVERYMREAKVMQIFEGTNQIQRLVIARHLARTS